MDLTPAFLDRWREHRDLDYLDRVRDVLDEATFDDDWVERVSVQALAREVAATLRLAGVDDVDEEAVIAVADRGEEGGLDAARLDAVRGSVAAYRTARQWAGQDEALTPNLLAQLHAQLTGGTQDGTPTAAGVAELCGWLAAPPDALHPAVVAALAHLELLRLRPFADANARMARLLLVLLLSRDGYDYRGMLAPSTHWSDPRRLPEQPAEELSPDQAETLPGVEHVVHGLAQAVRDAVIRARSEEGGGGLAEILFGFPLQP